MVWYGIKNLYTASDCGPKSDWVAAVTPVVKTSLKTIKNKLRELWSTDKNTGQVGGKKKMLNIQVRYLSIADLKSRKLLNK